MNKWTKLIYNGITIKLIWSNVAKTTIARMHLPQNTFIGLCLWFANRKPFHKHSCLIFNCNKKSSKKIIIIIIEIKRKTKVNLLFTGNIVLKNELNKKHKEKMKTRNTEHNVECVFPLNARVFQANKNSGKCVMHIMSLLVTWNSNVNTHKISQASKRLNRQWAQKCKCEKHVHEYTNKWALYPFYYVNVLKCALRDLNMMQCKIEEFIKCNKCHQFNEAHINWTFRMVAWNVRLYTARGTKIIRLFVHCTSRINKESTWQTIFESVLFWFVCLNSKTVNSIPRAVSAVVIWFSWVTLLIALQQYI